MTTAVLYTYAYMRFWLFN